MPSDSKFTRDNDGNVAVRVVSNTGVSEQPDSMFTTDEDGNVAVRVVFGEGGGGGGGDSHNKGFYATPTALNEAIPTAEAGDFAIVGSTDTVWIWDTDTNAWVDSDQKGQVTSVNNQTGDVTVQATLVSGTNIKSVNGESLLGSGNLEVSGFLPYPSGWTTNSTTKAFCDAVAADSSATVGKAYLGEVTFSDLPASMANAEVNVYINSGTTAANKVIVLELSSGNVAPYKWMYVYWNGGTNVSGWKTWQETLVSGTNIKTVNGNSLLGSGDISVGLPSQTGNAGKFLTTDGTDASWSNRFIIDNSNVRAGHATSLSGGNSVVIGSYSNSAYSYTVALGGSASASAEGGIALGAYSFVATWGTDQSKDAIAIGHHAVAKATRAIQLGSTGTTTNNFDANTFKVANTNGNFEMMSADGTIPTARLTKVNTAITLTSAGWSSNTQTVNVTGMTATGIVFPSPDPADQADYTSAGILCTAQAAGTLTFTCDTVPSNDIDVNIVML